MQSVAVFYFGRTKLLAFAMSGKIKRSNVLTRLIVQSNSTGVKKREGLLLQRITVCLQSKSTESAEKNDKAISFSKAELL